jgi:CRP-like cAMP-binding protein
MDLLEIFKDFEALETFPAGATIIEEGAEGNVMYVVVEGEVSITLKDKEIAIASQGEIVGEMALISSDLRSATVTATTDCRWPRSTRPASNPCCATCRISPCTS